jgi:hypothetical protein
MASHPTNASTSRPPRPNSAAENRFLSNRQLAGNFNISDWNALGSVPYQPAIRNLLKESQQRGSPNGGVAQAQQVLQTPEKMVEDARSANHCGLAVYLNSELLAVAVLRAQSARPQANAELPEASKTAVLQGAKQIGQEDVTSGEHLGKSSVPRESHGLN